MRDLRNGAALCVLAGEAHTTNGALQRLIDSVFYREGGALVSEVVIGYESTPPALTLPPDDVDFKLLPLGRLEDFGEARWRLDEVAEAGWHLHASADEVVAPCASPAFRACADDVVGHHLPPLHGELGAFAAITAITAKKDVNTLWFPTDSDVALGGGDDRERVHRRIFTRRLVRWSDGWHWRGRVHERCERVARGEDAKEVTAVAANLLFRHLPTRDRGDITSALRRVALTAATPPREWEAHETLARDLIVAGQYQEAALAAQQGYAAALRLENARGVLHALCVLSDALFESNLQRRLRADDGDSVSTDGAGVSEELARRFPDHPESLRRQLRFEHARTNWEHAADLFVQWRAREHTLGWARLRYEDDPFLRKTEPFALGADALLHCGKVELALHVLEQARQEVADPALDHLIVLARAQVPA